MILGGPRGTRLAAEVAVGAGARAKGLLGRCSLEPDQALLIRSRGSIHTFGMRFTIEAAFLDESLRVVRVLRLPPRRITRPRLQLRYVLECGVGAGLQPGDVLYEIQEPPTLPVTVQVPPSSSSTEVPPLAHSPPQ